MKRIVLDNSGLRGVSGPAFAAASKEMEFLVLPALFEELYTHRDANGKIDVGNAEEAYRLLKVACSAANCLHDVGILQFEIETGRSGRYAPVNPMKAPASLPVPSPEELGTMVAREKAFAEFFSFDVPEGYRENIGHLRLLKPPQFWAWLGQATQKTEYVRAFQTHATEKSMQFAAYKGWKLSEPFVPERDWLAFGYSLADFAFFYWKYWAYGGNVADPKKPANPAFDLQYVAHIAVCDGLLSADNTMLNIAWACWADKRDSVYTYCNARIVPYIPPWEVDHGGARVRGDDGFCP